MFGGRFLTLDFRLINSVHVVTKENVSLELVREGGLNNLEFKGDMNLQISDASLARVKLTLAEASTPFGPELQYKQHPNVGKFAANKERVIALKDPSRTFPVGQPLAVLKWRYAGKDETYVPLSSKWFEWVCRGVVVLNMFRDRRSQLLANAFE